MKTLIKLALVGASLAVAQGAWAQEKWDLPTGYGASAFLTENVNHFAKDVEEATNGKLKITVHPNGSLYKVNEIKRAVQTGQVQLGEFILSGSSNENAIFGVDSVPFLATNYADAKKLADASRQATEELLESQGMKVLFMAPWPGQSLFSNKEIKTAKDLSGTKMRTYNPSSSRVAELLHAQPVTIQLAELGQALATGAVDNFLTSSASGIENKLYEQVDYLYVVNAWLPKNAVIVNKKYFDKLDKPIQDALVRAGADAETRGWKVSEAMSASYLKELTENGMQVSEPSRQLKDELSAVGATMTEEWLKSAGPTGKAIIEAYKAK